APAANNCLMSTSVAMMWSFLFGREPSRACTADRERGSNPVLLNCYPCILTDVKLLFNRGQRAFNLCQEAIGVGQAEQSLARNGYMRHLSVKIAPIRQQLWIAALECGLRLFTRPWFICIAENDRLGLG